MLRWFIIVPVISAVLSSPPPSTPLSRFNYSCDLQKPLFNSRYPTIILDELELQVSHRVTHQVVSRVLAIFLKELFDYENVTISNKIDEYPKNYGMNEKEVEYAIVMELSQKDEAAINLEVWVSPDSHVAFPGNVMQSGSLHNDLSRFGLFIQDSLSAINYSYTDFITSSPTHNDRIKDFILDKEHEDILKKFTNHIHFPNQCNSTTEKCASVLTSHYEDMKFFKDHVNLLKLKTIVYFLGDDLTMAIRNLAPLIIKKNKKYLVLHWTPSEIIDGSTKYKSIAMPNCELYKNDPTKSCRYDLIPVSIFFNEKAKQSDDLVSLMNSLKFPSMKPLIKLVDLNKIEIMRISDSQKVLKKIDAKENIDAKTSSSLDEYYNEIACKWLKDNPNVYSIDNDDSWIPRREQEKEISIGGIFPPSGTGREYMGIDKVIEMAEKLVNDDPNLLPGYKLNVKKIGCECKPDLVLRTFINYYPHRSNLIGVLGPSCSEAVEPIAAISKHFKMNVITYSAEGISFDDRENYPYFYRTIGETKQYEDVYEKLLEKWNWKRLAALTEDGTKYTEYITSMESKLKSKSIDLIVNKKFPRGADKEKQFELFINYLKELRDKNRAKIIIADVHDHILMKQIMCAAYKLTMTSKNGFVWFLPVYVSMKMNDTGFQEVNGSCTDAEMKSALDGHLALSYSSFGQDDDEIEGNQTIGEWKERYLQATGMSRVEFTDYATFTYDAIWVYIKAVQQLIKEDSPKHRYMNNLNSDETMGKLKPLINNMDFRGVSGRVRFSQGGSRFTDVNILQWQGNDFVLIGSYTPKISNRTSNDGVLTLNDKVEWTNSERPSDGRDSCALQSMADFFNADCYSMHTFFTVVACILIVLACSALSFLFWKRKYDRKLSESEKVYGNYKNIMIGIELTKWEIARGNIVINRRLGEGAFGTVYGGEALIDEEDGWTAVAIKTLKPGSTAENRLDFLAEAETMKRFEHKNIVKLLAVCLQSEPLYAILEYMLYGDLKTYMLARRHLVNEKMNDDSDVSPRRLTLMALDIARGLSYLASMNYVHRDVACRNCMINAQRVVKLGDFGMARPTFESDYYRFARKGMLPVRWMAPESVDGGIFSHSTDIWSYGVLLYEIVTLGAFPFQGLNNNQVFEHVKLGNSITIPATCKPQLKALMSSCFSVDAKKRPGASTIVEFISNYPRMLTHCLDDVPKPTLEDQVNLIDAENIDENIEKFQQLIDSRDRSHTPATVDFLRTSVSSSALQNNHQDPSTFEYLDMFIPKKPNCIYRSEDPDLTATLPNGNYNPIQPLLQQTMEISKSNSSLMKYVPMCGFKNSHRSSDESTSAL